MQPLAVAVPGCSCARSSRAGLGSSLVLLGSYFPADKGLGWAQPLVGTNFSYPAAQPARQSDFDAQTAEISFGACFSPPRLLVPF